MSTISLIVADNSAAIGDTLPAFSKTYSTIEQATSNNFVSLEIENASAIARTSIGEDDANELGDVLVHKQSDGASPAIVEFAGKISASVDSCNSADCVSKDTMYALPHTIVGEANIPSQYLLYSLGPWQNLATIAWRNVFDIPMLSPKTRTTIALW